MIYTIAQLSKISGVTIRTLRYYDALGLLIPFSKGSNNYRYYKEEQLLRLQQILFFKELGFSLNDIKTLMLQNSFDNIKALKSHRRVLEDQIVHKNNLIDTINKTIMHLEGEEFMKDTELYFGFDSNRQKEYEKYLVDYKGLKAEELLIESKKRTAKWDKDEWDIVQKEGDFIHQSLAKAIDNGLEPNSEEVQSIIQKHFQMTEKFYDVSKEVYIGLTDLYSEHPDFKKFFDLYHPNMIAFISEAMKYYAYKNL